MSLFILLALTTSISSIRNQKRKTSHKNGRRPLNSSGSNDDTKKPEEELKTIIPLKIDCDDIKDKIIGEEKQREVCFSLINLAIHAQEKFEDGIKEIFRNLRVERDQKVQNIRDLKWEHFTGKDIDSALKAVLNIKRTESVMVNPDKEEEE